MLHIAVYNLRPSEPKYCKTWDVSNVLGYLRKLSPIKFISLKDLTLKLVMLIVMNENSFLNYLRSVNEEVELY
jgi:hypothetical protein